MQSKKRILVLSNYPIKQPLHGGQKRVAAIVEEYRKVFAAVKFVAIFVREHYPIYDRDDIYLKGPWAAAALHDHLTSDIRIGLAMRQSPAMRRKIKKLLTSFRPDIIQVEQVFPFIGLQEILAELGMKPEIIHSSHNIETATKKEVMTIGGAAAADINKAVRLIDEAETYLAQHANLVVAVSQEDGKYYIGRGAKRYVLAPNGINKAMASKSSLLGWQKFFANRRIQHIAAFIGSSHLPNVQGLQQMIGWRLGFLALDARLVLAGSVGLYLQEHFDDDNLLDTTFWQRTVNLGILKESELSGLINTAAVLLLPIVKGGGSNLKTAEAILSGKKIVSTTFAFRGYEQHMDLPNIWIADTPKDFRAGIIEAFQAPLQARTPQQEAQAAQVQWHYCLQPLLKEVVKL